MNSDPEFTKILQELHAHRVVTVELGLTDDHEAIDWTITVQGEDFLNGEWEKKVQGRSENYSESLLDAIQSLGYAVPDTRPWWKKMFGIEEKR